ncbi:ABC transporter permease [Modestobacter excelsi]|uniref:ABC transporter permease n=1 Tax=Modestobacter excelsi TaxID=2213161 RepID=UPI00110D152E|nr:ABC transporter permease [Modestobacter excelsi]
MAETQTVTASNESSGSGDPPQKDVRESVLPQIAIPLLLVASFVLFSFLAPGLFFTGTNVRIIIASQATLLVLAVGATIPLRAGDFDLSIAAVMVLSASLVAAMGNMGWPLAVIVLAVLATGVLVGLINSFFIVGLELSGFVVTLGMLTLLAGISNLVTGGETLATVPVEIRDLTNTRVLGLPLAVWIGWVFAAVVLVVFQRLPLGRYLLFLGGNPTAAQLAGLRVKRLRTGALVSSSFLGAVAGVLLAGTLGAVDPGSGGGYLLAPFTAAFLGTTMLHLRQFNVLGTLIGLYLLAVVITGLQLLGVAVWVADVFNGAALVLAIAFARVLELRSQRNIRRTTTT